jgi:membrane protease YdiL (CAAX protease family)
MDGPRRHFDDIDGCGGPPQGELVALDATGPRRGGRGFARRSSRAGRSPSSARGPERVPPRAVAGGDSGRHPTIAVASVAAATVAATVVATFVDADAFASIAEPLARRVVVPFVLAAIAFEAILAVGLVVARNGTGPSPLRPPTRIGGEALLRGGAAFLLALLASSFLTSLAPVRAIAWSAMPASLDPLLVVEVVLTVLVAPVVEERMFRGLVLVVLRDRYGPVAGVLGQAAVSAAAVGWMAESGGRAGTVLAAFATASVFGWFAHNTDDLTPGMIGHAFLAAWLLAGRIGF